MGFRQPTLENLVIDVDFWKNRQVFITGHTGFKGSWLALWLEALGAQVVGYALAPPTNPNLFQIAQVEKGMYSVTGDLADRENLTHALQQQEPEIVIHMAAQSLVRRAYRDPVQTFATNVQGTVHLLEAVRQLQSVRAVVVVTSDKCYQNQEWSWGYRENDPMGGDDPYSASKGCAELVVSAYRNSFFTGSAVMLASARAGNVIGGGDWSEDRLIPDIVRAFQAEQHVVIRNPEATRPWQHVLESLHGYLLLAQKLVECGASYAQGWNFGPMPKDCCTVSEVVNITATLWGNKAEWTTTAKPALEHEAHMLRLDSSLAQIQLDWHPVLSLNEALAWTVEWYQAYQAGVVDMRNLTLEQIQRFLEKHNKKINN